MSDWNYDIRCKCLYVFLSCVPLCVFKALIIKSKQFPSTVLMILTISGILNLTKITNYTSLLCSCISFIFDLFILKSIKPALEFAIKISDKQRSMLLQKVADNSTRKVSSTDWNWYFPSPSLSSYEGKTFSFSRTLKHDTTHNCKAGRVWPLACYAENSKKGQKG